MFLLFNKLLSTFYTLNYNYCFIECNELNLSEKKKFTSSIDKFKTWCATLYRALIMIRHVDHYNQRCISMMPTVVKMTLIYNYIKRNMLNHKYINL